LDGYATPLIVQAGLARLPIHPYTDTEWDSLPHVFLTEEEEWDHTVMDHKFIEDEPWEDDYHPIKGNTSLNTFDDFGNYRHRVVVQYTDFLQRNDGSIYLDDIIDQCVYYTHQQPSRTLLCWLPPDTIKKTFENTIQYAHIPT
jgi:hypothetical protein